MAPEINVIQAQFYVVDDPDIMRLMSEAEIKR